MDAARALTTAAGVFLAANLLHGVDHLRQGVDALHLAVKAGGAVTTLAAVVVLVLAARRHRLAVPAAGAVGFAATVGVTSAHLLPHWSVLSNSYVDDVTVDAGSWVVVVLEIAAAFVLGCVALRSMSQRQGARHG